MATILQPLVVLTTLCKYMVFIPKIYSLIFVASHFFVYFAVQSDLINEIKISLKFYM